MKCATPDFVACVAAPPSSSKLTSSPVTVFTTSGPVMNMYEVSSTMSDEVGDRGRVDGASGARPHDERDLRDDARRLHVAPEDLRVARERHDTLLDPRTARVVDPDDRAAVLHGEIHDLADLLGEDLRQRPAEHGEVLREDEHLAAEDRPVAGDDGVAPRPVLAHVELDLAVTDEAVELDERARIEELLEPLAREELPALALALDVPSRSPD